MVIVTNSCYKVWCNTWWLCTEQYYLLVIHFSIGSGSVTVRRLRGGSTATREDTVVTASTAHGTVGSGGSIHKVAR